MGSRVSTWDWLSADPFAGLLAMADDCYPAGLGAARAAVAVFDDSRVQLHRLHALGVRGQAVGKIDRCVVEHVGGLPQWDAAALAGAASGAGWKRELCGVDLEALLRVTTLRGSDRLPLFAVMSLLGRDEVVRRARDDLEAFRQSCLVG